jgi:divalent metal cation (Fe/Co/Zn/Cd) transporter
VNQPDWRKRALWLAGFTILFNLLEGGASVAFGWADDSVALFGFGVDSFIEVASACLVLWKLLDHGSLARERKATLWIGRLFVALGAGIAGGSLLQLAGHRHPPTTVPGLVISTLSLAFMVFLWRAKLRAAKGLDSATVAADAACSLACIQLSLVLFAGSLLFLVAPGLWWADAAAGLLLAGLILKEGVTMIRAAQSECFTGGCGCAR